jgi:hypothetical protein
VLCLAILAGTTGLLARQSVRVVDSVVVGAAGDEASHRFSGSETNMGKSAGRTWRGATGWFSYSLRIYDDSPLTIVCVLADGEGAAESFDILVDDRKAATFTREPAQSKAAELRVNLRLQETEGKTSVVVKLAAHPGSSTARLLELRTLQEHLE